MFRLTPLVRNLIIINVVVFLAQNLLSNLYVTEYLALWSVHSPNFKPYQFFTYMFAHGGFGHIFFNMLSLASFAPILESHWGDKKFLTFYLATGIGAGVVYALVNLFLGTSAGGIMLGASGALYGILMAFGMVFPNLEIMLLFPPVPIKAKYMVFIMGFITYALDRSGTVAHLAHFGGAFVGFIIISIWRSQGKDRSW
jgi:membrane associated rhomboid family serine protease